jgi:O-methyltransferase involved in polyketide biosynthesis
MPTYNEQSSFTAQGLVLRRMLYTDLPLAHEIFDALEKIHPMSAVDREWASRPSIIPFFEARYLMTDRIISQHGIHQILELASGLSPRGLAMAKDPAYTFAEVDLPSEIELKKRVIENLVAAGVIVTPGKNFHLVEGNVVDKKVFDEAIAFFHNEPIAVVCEGLLRYLSFDDKATLATHVHGLLKKFGGVWITPDIEVRTDEDQRRHRNDVGMHGIDVEENLFESVPATQKFFESFGFTVAIMPLKDMTKELVSPARAGLTEEEVTKIMENRMAFTMTAK